MRWNIVNIAMTLYGCYIIRLGKALLVELSKSVAVVGEEINDAPA